MPKAYSYVRFSSPEQAKGNSLQRQVAMAADYAAQNGLELDDSTFQDLGVSAYKGKNVIEGALGAFKVAVESGLIASDSWLLVEALDRLSRQTARKAARVLEDICDLGITVVTLNDKKVYTEESLDSDLTSFLISILIFMRSNEESEIKSKRLGAAWRKKRDDAIEKNKPLTPIVTGWLRLNRDTNTIEPIPERAALVQRIYNSFLAGNGQGAITQSLNADGVPCWGRGKGNSVGKIWHTSYIRRILTNPAVIGSFTPHTLTREATGIQRTAQTTIDHYYPPVVDEITFTRVQELLAGKGVRGRKLSQEVKNILSFLGRCPACGGTMTRINKGENFQYLVCQRAKNQAGCVYKTVPYGKVEAAILKSVPLMLPAIKTDSQERTDLRRKIAKLERENKQRQLEIRRLIELVKAGKGDDVTWVDTDPDGTSFGTVRSEIGELEMVIEGNHAQIELFEKEYQSSSPKLIDEKFAALLSAIKTGASMAEINAGMRSVFDRAVIDYEHGMVQLWFKHRKALALPIIYS